MSSENAFFVTSLSRTLLGFLRKELLWIHSNGGGGGQGMKLNNIFLH
jgi:hypothetical protein